MSKDDLQAELLSGYLDSELSGSDLERVTSALSESKELQIELENLKNASGVLGTYFRSVNASYELDLWSQIETSIKPHTIKPKDLSNQKPRFWEAVFAPRLTYAFLSAFGVFMFAFGLMTQSWVESPGSTDTQVAGNKNSQVLVPVITDTRQLTGDVQFVSNGGVSGFSPRFIRPHTLGADHPARNAGYRADSMDIEWMKSAKGFKILRPSRRELPPVLWIGETQ